MVDALFRRPQVSVVCIVYHDELEMMKDEYVEDEHRIYDQLVNG